MPNNACRLVWLRASGLEGRGWEIVLGIEGIHTAMASELRAYQIQEWFFGSGPRRMWR